MNGQLDFTSRMGGPGALARAPRLGSRGPYGHQAMVLSPWLGAPGPPFY